MQLKELLLGINAELCSLMEAMDEAAMARTEARIREAERIFVAGTGRSALMIRAFAMRLMQAGFTVHVVGETTTPAITPKDLLIIASGSGSTATMVAVAQRCKAVGAKLLLITTTDESPIAQMADDLLIIPAFSSKRSDNAASSIQIGANGFEQMVLLVGDTIAIDLMRDAGRRNGSADAANAELMMRHANLE